jgi:hypothetical protein
VLDDFISCIDSHLYGTTLLKLMVLLGDADGVAECHLNAFGQVAKA